MSSTIMIDENILLTIGPRRPHSSYANVHPGMVFMPTSPRICKIEHSELFSGISPKYGETECAICLIDFSENCRVYQTDCDHVFHIECLFTWYGDCPTCKNKILYDRESDIDIYSDDEMPPLVPANEELPMDFGAFNGYFILDEPSASHATERGKNGRLYILQNRQR